MSGLTLGDIKTYLTTTGSKIIVGDSCTIAKTNIASNTYNIKDADAFLLSKMNLAHITFNTSNTTNDNFLTLYNDQYARNTEALVGILIISAILAKMIFYPISI